METLGCLYVLSAPSGAGKTSLVKALCESVQNILVSVSHTTRAMRPGEREGEDYYFVSQADFKSMLADNKFLEHASVFEHYYGTSQAWVTKTLASGSDILLELDWQGARQVRVSHPHAVTIFILPPNKAALEDRLIKRSQDEQSVIEKRMQAACEEMSHYIEYDYLIINDDFDRALRDMQAIILSQRLQMDRQADLQAKRIEKLIS